ncbi:flavin reductase [Streptomyces desertarenae]|uniref:Flavin reductase n=1 Tax=Streptomyces desertarenae TaxID=2666184 RepID=A0ABW4PRI7_9ACTN
MSWTTWWRCARTSAAGSPRSGRRTAACSPATCSSTARALFARPAENRFGQVTWRTSPGAGLPWLADDAFAVAECTVSNLSEIADHTAVIGEVTGVAQEPGVPLLYGARGFAAWPGGTVPGSLAAPEGVAS